MCQQKSNHLTGRDFLEIIDRTPLVSIDLILRDRENNALLGRRTNRPAKGYWFVPGGRILKNEPLQEAFERICSNEVGRKLPFEAANLTGAFTHIYPDNYWGARGINTHYVVLAYRCYLDPEAPIRGDDQHDDLKWWPVADLLKDPAVHPNTKRYFID